MNKKLCTYLNFRECGCATVCIWTWIVWNSRFWKDISNFKLLSRNIYVLIVMMESENRYSKYIGKINLKLYFYTNLPNGIPNFCSYQLLCNYCHYWLHDFFSNNDPLEKKRLIYKNQNYFFFLKTTYMISWIFVTIRISHRQNMEIYMVQKIITITIDQPVNQKGGSC